MSSQSQPDVPKKHPSKFGNAFNDACRSRPTLYRAEHHISMYRAPRHHSIDSSWGLCDSDHTGQLLTGLFRRKVVTTVDELKPRMMLFSVSRKHQWPRPEVSPPCQGLLLSILWFSDRRRDKLIDDTLVCGRRTRFLPASCLSPTRTPLARVSRALFTRVNPLPHTCLTAGNCTIISVYHSPSPSA